MDEWIDGRKAEESRAEESRVVTRDVIRGGVEQPTDRDVHS